MRSRVIIVVVFKGFVIMVKKRELEIIVVLKKNYCFDRRTFRGVGAWG